MHVACNFNCLTETEGLPTVTGSHVLCKSGNISKTEMLLLQTTNRKSYMFYRITAIPMTLSDLQGHSPIASHF